MMIRSHIFLAATLAFTFAAAIAEPLPEAPGSTIGYPTVAAALQALRARPDIHLSVQGGWTLAEDGANHTFWAFSPEGDPSYPSAIKRVITERNGDVYIEMGVDCEASKAACDKLVIDFQRLNDSIRERVAKGR